MGFRTNSYATVWSVEPVKDTITKCRISINRKDRNTGEYVQDFGGFVSFVGTATAKKASLLKERDKIRLKEVDVTNHYDKERNTTYTNFSCFAFETESEFNNGENGTQQAAPTNRPDFDVNYGVDSGEPDEELPY